MFLMSGWFGQEVRKLPALMLIALRAALFPTQALCWDAWCTVYGCQVRWSQGA